MNFVLKSRKVGVIGTGNMGQGLIRALLSSRVLDKTQIFATNRSERKLERVVEEYGISKAESNEQIVENCDIVFICVKPQDLMETLRPISMLFNSRQLVLSLAAGIPLKTILSAAPSIEQLVRVMPNTGVKIGQGVVGYCLSKKAMAMKSLVEDLLNPMGMVVSAEEGDPLEAVVVCCASGPGFLYEFMIYWADWLEEHGFEPELAREMTVKTFLGAAMVASQYSLVPLEELQKQVASKRGTTEAGLDSIREEGLERILRIGFEKSALRDRELGKQWK